MGLDSKEYSWRWVTASGRLSHGPCELVYVAMYPDAANDSVTIYDGEGIKGEKLVNLFVGLAFPAYFNPPVPAYCNRGLYVDVTQAPKGTFIMWREM